MRTIPQYNFHKTKYGDELLVDVVSLPDIKKYLSKETVHSLTYYDITLITTGTGKFHINDQSYLVTKGDVIFSKPGDIRSWDIHTIQEGYALIFEEEFLLSFFNDRNFLQQMSYFKMERSTSFLTIDDENYQRLSYCIQTIKKEIHDYSIIDRHILRALLYEVLMLLNRAYIQAAPSVCNSPDNRREHVSRFISLVSQKLPEHHSIGFYADKLCLTANYLNEIVKSTTGVSAKSYIQNKLLVEAKKLLLYSDRSVTEIAELLHYESASYFIRFFRSHTGSTPLEYRKTRKP
ncbi:MAG: AraC family transcriptional regulator [Tannerellaceae bacterium]|nr:AraC family transcriptional regulator [Tannerellaceae bacterium]